MNHNQKWAFIKKEAWSRQPVECEVLIQAGQNWNKPPLLVLSMKRNYQKLAQKWKMIDHE